MTYKIERLGHLGDGVAAGPVFADRTLPGEVITGDLYGDRLSDVRIVTPSDMRISPKCPAYKRCGGCALHHAHDDFVSTWKQGVVTRALSAQGINAEVGAIHTSPANSRRRAKLTGHRTKKGAVVGFLGRASDTIQPIQGCMILHPTILEMIPSLEEFTSTFGSRKGRLGFWILVTDTGLDIAVDGLVAPRDQSLSNYAEWAAQHGLARLSIGDEVVCQLTDPILTFGTVRVSPPPKAFTQATTNGEAALQSAVARAVGDAKSILDLFAGCGTLGLP
ncbi:MAG: class I SAM-dependent RNA methyltransferase, partial [Planktomarina sp.]